MSSESLTRVPKPLRCTSLHQTISAGSPSTHTGSLCDSLLPSLPNELDSGTGSTYSSSSDDASMQSDGDLRDSRADAVGYLDKRRMSSTTEKRHSRASSGHSLKYKSPGLSLTYTSATTTAHAINEVFTRRESFADIPSDQNSMENERVNFLAELPEAISRARKVHYRRDALLPKIKSFHRVQLSLKEESAPFEAELQKEAKLASILKGKATVNKDVAEMGQLDQAMGNAYTSRPPVKSDIDPVRSGQAIPRPNTRQLNAAFSERDDTLFRMEDITSSPQVLSHTSTSIQDNDLNLESRLRSSRSGRSNKRKNDEGRYEPYMMLNKRRALSPSPGSPLGSPNVTGSIFRIENLTL